MNLSGGWRCLHGSNRRIRQIPPNTGIAIRIPNQSNWENSVMRVIGTCVVLGTILLGTVVGKAKSEGQCALASSSLW